MQVQEEGSFDVAFKNDTLLTGRWDGGRSRLHQRAGPVSRTELQICSDVGLSTLAAWLKLASVSRTSCSSGIA